MAASPRTKDLVVRNASSDASLPSVVQASGPNARYAYEEFFAGLDSSHTARAYRHAVHRFLDHCSEMQTALAQVTPGMIAGYIKGLRSEAHGRKDESVAARPSSKPTRKLHLAALRHFFDKLVQRHAVPLNPALSVRGPRHSVQEGKTPAMEPKQIRELIESIPTTTKSQMPDLAGLRDRAVIATLVYTAARAGAVAKLSRGDFYTDGRQHYLRLDEKGGKMRSIPCRTDLQQFLEEYLDAATPADQNAPLFSTIPGRAGRSNGKPITSNDILRMLKRRLRGAGLPQQVFKCHSLRASTATNLLEQGVELADVQFLLGHSDPRTTKLYDRRKLAVTRNIVERIAI
jgi:site-specific recombinase XerD